MLQNLYYHHQRLASGLTADATCTADALYITADGRKALRADALVTADSGSFTADGWYPCGGTVNYTLTAQGGSYSVVGQDAVVARSKYLAASGGAYALTGQSVAVSLGRLLTAQGGSYSVTGSQAELKLGKTLTAQGGTYALSGQSAGVYLGKTLTAQGGTYNLAGQDAAIEKATPGAYVLTARGGTYTLTGQQSVCTIGGKPSITYGTHPWLMPPRERKRKTREEIEEVEDAIEEVIVAVEHTELPADPDAVIKALRTKIEEDNLEWKQYYEPLLFKKVKDQIKGLVDEVSSLNRTQMLQLLQDEEDEERAVIELMFDL
jgi:hypothetical protein